MEQGGSGQEELGVETRNEQIAALCRAAEVLLNMATELADEKVSFHVAKATKQGPVHIPDRPWGELI